MRLGGYLRQRFYLKSLDKLTPENLRYPPVALTLFSQGLNPHCIDKSLALVSLLLEVETAAE